NRNVLMIIDGSLEARRHGAARHPVFAPGIQRGAADVTIDKGPGNERRLVAARPRHVVVMDRAFIVRRIVQQDMDGELSRKAGLPAFGAHAPSSGSVAMASLASMAAISSGDSFSMVSSTCRLWPPKGGADRNCAPGVRLRWMGSPGCRCRPASGCSSSVKSPRWAR